MCKMSFFELQNNTEGIRKIRSGAITNEMIIDELRQMKIRITELESMLGCGKTIDKSKTKKQLKTSGLLKNVINIILVQPDDDIPDGYESILVIFEENYGELINIRTEEIERLCEEILMSPDGKEVFFPEYITTSNYAILNGDGDWEIKKREIIETQEE